MIDTIVQLVAERVDEIVQRRVEEIVERRLAELGRGSGRRGPDGTDGGRR